MASITNAQRVTADLPKADRFEGEPLRPSVDNAVQERQKAKTT